MYLCQTFSQKSILLFLVTLAEHENQLDFKMKTNAIPLYNNNFSSLSITRSTSSKSIKEFYSKYNYKNSADQLQGLQTPTSIPSPTNFQITKSRVKSSLPRDTLQSFPNKQLEISKNKTTINSFDVSEELIHDLIYSFSGIQGKFLRKDIVTGRFILDPKARNISNIQAGMVSRLTELGYYHDQIQAFTDKKSGKCPFGLLGQGLISALNRELTQYYGMIATLKEQLDRSQMNNSSVTKLTLSKIMIWAVEPLQRLYWLATVAETCQEKKGGELASSIFNFMANGDQSVRIIIKELLRAVCVPFQNMLSKWLLDGEIEDPHSEFFIEILPDAGPDRLWHDKYRIKEGSLPNFIKKYIFYF